MPLSRDRRFTGEKKHRTAYIWRKPIKNKEGIIRLIRLFQTAQSTCLEMFKPLSCKTYATNIHLNNNKSINLVSKSGRKITADNTVKEKPQTAP